MCLVFTAVALMGQLKGVYDNHTQPSSQPPTSGFQTSSMLVEQWRLVILMGISVLPNIPFSPTSLQYTPSQPSTHPPQAYRLQWNSGE